VSADAPAHVEAVVHLEDRSQARRHRTESGLETRKRSGARRATEPSADLGARVAQRGDRRPHGERRLAGIRAERARANIRGPRAARRCSPSETRRRSRA
jgi:hypothetical protein